MPLTFEDWVENGYGCVYFRKLGNRTHWFAEDIEKQLPQVAAQCFKPNTQECLDSDQGLDIQSLYRACNEIELKTIIYGLSSSRGFPADKMDLIFFTREELADSGLSVSMKPGETICSCCNLRHVNVTGTRRQIESLCELSKDRKTMRFSRASVEQTYVETAANGCNENTISSCYFLQP